MQTNTPVLNKVIYRWMYTMKHSKCHLPMAMRVRLGTFSNLHGHGSARAERVCLNIFWGKYEYGRAHLLALRPEEDDDDGCDDRAETRGVG